MSMSHHKMTKRLKEKRYKRLSSAWLRSLSSGKYSIFNKCGIFGVDKIAILEWLCRILLCLMRAINIFKCIDVYTFMLSPTYNVKQARKTIIYIDRYLFSSQFIWRFIYFFPLLSVISCFFFLLSTFSFHLFVSFYTLRRVLSIFRLVCLSLLKVLRQFVLNI